MVMYFSHISPLPGSYSPSLYSSFLGFFISFGRMKEDHSAMGGSSEDSIEASKIVSTGASAIGVSFELVDDILDFFRVNLV